MGPGEPRGSVRNQFSNQRREFIGGAVGKQAQMLILDPVLHVGPGTIFPIVELEPAIATASNNNDRSSANSRHRRTFQAGCHALEHQCYQSPARSPSGVRHAVQ